MGYRVKIFPADKPAGFLAFGRVGGYESTGTYFPHPGPAIVAAERYAAQNPGVICHVLTWKDGALVKEVVK